MSVALIIVIAYIAAMFLIGFLLTKRSTGASELFIARGQLNLWLLIPLLFGEIIAGASVTGTAQGGFTQGISAVWTFVGKGLGCVVFALVLSKFFSAAGKDGVMSVPEAFHWRFNSAVRYVIVFIVIVPLTLVCSSQCRAVASLLAPMLDLDTNMLIVLAGVSFGVMALTGLKGLAHMNIVHSLVIFFGVMIVSFICADRLGGIGEVFANLPKGHGDLTYPSIPEILGQFISATLAFCVAVTPANACYSNVNTKINIKALCIAGVLAAVFSFFPAIIGLCGSILLPNVDANTILYTMPETISSSLAGVASMAVLAAVLSTAPFLFLSFGTVFVRDIILPVKGDISDHDQLKIVVVVTIVFTLLVIYLSLNNQQIFAQFIGANHIKAVAAFALIVSLAWKRLTNRAVFWSVLITGALSTIWYFSGTVFGVVMEPLWPALALESAMLITITFLDKRNNFKDYERYLVKRKNAEQLDNYQDHAA